MALDATLVKARKPMKTDPVEQTPEYLAIEKELEQEIKLLLPVKRTRGHCYRYWEVKKKILKKNYGIDWKSPKELNPRIKFD